MRALLYDSPDEILLSTAFPSAFQSVLTALTLLTPQIVLTALDALRDVIGHEALSWDPSNAAQLPPFQQQKFQNYPQFSMAIRAVVEASAVQLVQLLLDVLVGGGEDEPYTVITILRMLSLQFPSVLAANVPVAVEQLPTKAAGPSEKVEFLEKFNAYVPLPLLTCLCGVRPRLTFSSAHEQCPPGSGSFEGQRCLHLAVPHFAQESRARTRSRGSSISQNHHPLDTPCRFARLPLLLKRKTAKRWLIQYTGTMSTPYFFVSLPPLEYPLQSSRPRRATRSSSLRRMRSMHDRVPTPNSLA